jgi:Flp pilus assembly protein TadG
MRLFHHKLKDSTNRWKRTGAAVAEFGFVAPILALVLMGMIELCRGIMVKVTLSDAAREGCRTGIQRDMGNSQITQDCTKVMQNNGFDTSKFNPSGGLGKINITVTDPSSGSTVNGNESLDAPSGSVITVQVAIPVSSTTWVPQVFLPTGSTESETIVMMKQ